MPHSTVDDLGRALLGALLMATVSTLAEWVWELLSLPHRMSYGLMHGALIFLILGLFLGAVSGRESKLMAGAIGGLLAGVAAAGTFYLLVPVLRFAAMFAAWFAVWIFFGLLRRHLAQDGESAGSLLLRGLLAGITSGLGFYAISSLWSSQSAGGNNYWLFFGSWTLAFFPGIACLTWGRSQRIRYS